MNEPKSPDELTRGSFDIALGAVTQFYNLVVAEKDDEIKKLQAELERTRRLYRDARDGKVKQ